MKECKDLSKTRDFFVFVLLVFVYYSPTISSIMTAASLAVTDRRCAVSSLLIGVCICDVGECESANVSATAFFFLHETMTVLTRY